MNTDILCFCENEDCYALMAAQCSALSSAISELGLTTRNISVTDKCGSDATETVLDAVKQSEILMIVGGIGESNTGKTALCHALSLATKKNDRAIEIMQRYCRVHSVEFKNEWAGAMLFPADAAVLENPKGAFCGFGLCKSGRMFVVLPFLQTGFEELLRESVLPYLAKQLGFFLSFARVSAFGLKHERAGELCKQATQNHALWVKAEKNSGITCFTVTAKGNTQSEADTYCESALFTLRDALGDDLFEIGGRTLARVTVDALKRSGLTVSTAESCTGGMVSEAITSVPGASDVLEMGICAYSNRIKENGVGIPPDIIERYGAVSKETAALLAKGICTASHSSIGIGVTGVAGPEPSEGKPVGTVFVGLSNIKNTWVVALDANEFMSRDEIRTLATNTALDLIRRYIAFLPDTMPAEFESPVLQVALSLEKSLTNNVPQQQDTEEPLPVTPKKEPTFPKKSETVPKKEKKNPFSSCRKRSGKKPIRPTKIVFFSVIAVILAVTVFMVTYFTTGNRELSYIKDARIVRDNYSVSESFARLTKQNPDFKGWLTLPGTDLDHPIYKASDNTYYSSHNMAGKSSRYGALYFDCNNTVSGDSASRNLIIYGKNMNDSAMFGILGDYTSSTFYQSHTVLKLNTGVRNDSYLVFCVMVMNAKKEDDNGTLFNFMRSSFTNENDFAAWKNELSERSLYKTSVELNYTDNFLTLVTTSEAFDNARLVVMAKRMDNGESGVINISVNSSPHYPQAWYDKHKSENPYR